MGSPDMPPPPNVIEQLSQSAAQPNKHGYSGYRGIGSFRQAVAGYYARRHGVVLDPETEVLPLLGSKEGVVNLALAYVDSGDVVLVPEIGYPAYEMGARLAGGEVVYAPMPRDDGYLIDFDQIAAPDAERASLLWVNYPNNPTGALANTGFYNRAVDFCRKYDILLTSDNPYIEVTYDDRASSSVLQADGAKDYAVEFMSFSKTYNMAGWRLGAAVGSAEALKRLLHIKSNMDSGHFKPIYEAGITALNETPQNWIDERNQIYQQRRDYLLAALPEIGLQAICPGGAMYVWAEVLDGDGEAYSQAARQEAHVSIAPGTAYGPAGKNFVRFSVSVPDERLDDAIDRLKRWYTA
jgi:LL-diaminopimelate aminotransferase